MIVQYLKHLTVHTAVEGVLARARALLALPMRARHPELSELSDEPHYFEAACRMLLTPESNTIDVGAHLGSQLGMFVDLAPRGRHMAFEPVPHKARWLRSKFPRVDVRQTALSDSAGEDKFFVNVTRPGFSGLRPHASPDDVLEKIVVEQRPLDEVLESQQTVDLIKIDVEGAELLVLKGAERLLARCYPTLLFESTRSAMQIYAVKPEDIFDFLAERNYRVYLLRAFMNGGQPLEREEFAEAHEYPFRAFNFIACSVHRAFGRRLVHKRSVSGFVPAVDKARVA
jgi:FkbM family methyltransferase